MRARIWSRAVLVFWGTILLYAEEKSWLPLKIHCRCFTCIQLPPAGPIAHSFVTREKQLTATALCQQQGFPFLLFRYWGGRPGRPRGIGHKLPSKLYSLKTESQRKAQSQNWRNVASSCRNNDPMALPRQVKVNLQRLTSCPLIFANRLRQPMSFISHCHQHLPLLIHRFSSKVFILWDMMLSSRSYLGIPQENRTDHLGTHWTSSEELLMEKKQLSKSNFSYA